MTNIPPLGLGIAGLGLAGSMLIRAARKDARFALKAGADPRLRPRETFARDFGVRSYTDFEDLCADDDVEAIYIASQHEYHRSQTILALPDDQRNSTRPGAAASPLIRLCTK